MSRGSCSIVETVEVRGYVVRVREVVEEGSALYDGLVSLPDATEDTVHEEIGFEQRDECLVRCVLAVLLLPLTPGDAGGSREPVRC